MTLVLQSTDAADLRRAYRKLSLQLHPDKNKEEDAEIKFRQVMLASFFWLLAFKQLAKYIPLNFLKYVDGLIVTFCKILKFAWMLWTYDLAICIVSCVFGNFVCCMYYCCSCNIVAEAELLWLACLISGLFKTSLIRRPFQKHRCNCKLLSWLFSAGCCCLWSIERCCKKSQVSTSHCISVFAQCLWEYVNKFSLHLFIAKTVFGVKCVSLLLMQTTTTTTTI